MTERTWLTVYCLIANARYETLKCWRDSWQLWPGAKPSMETCLYYARQLEEINDAHIELVRLYRGTSPE